MRKIIALVMCYLFLFSCNSKTLDNDEYDIINIVIANRIETSFHQMRTNKDGNKNDTLKLKGYFFSLYEDLKPIDPTRDVYGNLRNEYGSRYFKRYTQPLKVDLHKIKPANGARIVDYSPKNETNNYYLGRYKFSRVIFNDTADKAVIEFIGVNPTALVLHDKALIFLRKKDHKWIITQERGLFYDYE
jgi:hypothetical protein